MKKKSVAFLFLMLVFSAALAYSQENTADSLILQAEEALKHRNPTSAFQLLEEASNKVRSQTNAIYKYEIMLRIANLQATNENLWEILISDDLNKNLIDKNLREIEQHLKQFAELIEIAGTNGNPLESKTYPHEVAAANKILETLDMIGSGHWASAPGLAFDADVEIGKAISALTTREETPKAVPPSAPSKPGKRDVSKNSSCPGALSALGLFFIQTQLPWRTVCFFTYFLSPKDFAYGILPRNLQIQL